MELFMEKLETLGLGCSVRMTGILTYTVRQALGSPCWPFESLQHD